MVIINGNAADAAGNTVSQYLSQTNYAKNRVAVEINGEIVPKSQYESTILNDGDSVEIVGFVGGG